MTTALREIASENEKFAEKNPYKSSSTIPVAVSLLLKHKALLSCSPSPSKKECKVDFQQSTSERAILDTSKKSKSAKICVLNFADRKMPGGLYLQGVNTQEESLCRAMPGLFRSLRGSQAYPYQSYETVLWTPHTWFQRDPQNHFHWLTHPVSVAVLSAAAPNLPEGEEFLPKPFGKLVEAIVLAPYLFGLCDVLILGSLGTGAFRNDPIQVANAFARAVKKHGHLYSRIVFAIPEAAKLDLFAKQFEKHTQKD